MRKLLYTMVALFAALTATSCLYGVGADSDVEVENTSGFKVDVSTTVISSNGEDVVQFRALFNGEDVSAESTLYDAATDKPYEELNFSTYVAGIYQFYVTYGEYRSDIITITAKTDIDLSDKQEEGLSVSLSTNLVQVGKSYAAFIVRYNGKVLTADEVLKLSIYDAQNDEKYTVEDSVGALFTYVAATDDNGVEYLLPAYTPNQVGTKSFWVSYKISNTRTKPVQITAVNTKIPARPVDLEPENLDFVHRTMLIQLTGIRCGYCPWLVSALHSVAEDENYKGKYVHTAVHGAAYDPLYKVSVSGIDLGEMIHPGGGYPYMYYDFAASHSGGYGVATDIAYIQTYIDNRLEQQARAAIAVRTELEDNMLLVRASVKVNTEGEYYVGCWLLESNLYAQQSNSTEVREDYLDYHENVVRIADSCPTGDNCLGYPLGIVNAGDRADHLFVMELNPSWNVDNCHLVLFVTTNIDKFRSVTNVVRTTSLTSGVEFEY